MLKPAAIYHKLYSRIYWSLDYHYRYSYLRKAILRVRARERTQRFFEPGHRRFVIFLVPGINIVNGGQMSICSIASETQKLLAPNSVSVGVCTASPEPRILKYTKFDNDLEILAFADLLPRFPSNSDILVHVPELFVRRYASDCMDVYRSRPDVRWRFNILLQNIDRIPSRKDVASLQGLGTTTVTIAHEASAKAAAHLGCPVHYLSWFLSAEDFERVPYVSKKRLIAISPDQHPAKDEIVREISKALPDHRIVEIRNMTYREYKSVIRDAKFMFTFGEGLDGYFVESIFSGSVAMAIFKEQFFTAEYFGLDGLFIDEKEAQDKVNTFLRSADNEATFGTLADRQYNLVVHTFDRKKYRQNVIDFYYLFFSDWLPPQTRDLTDVVATT